MNVYWLEQTEVDLPAENDWLSPAEAARYSRLRFPKRRADWRLGRWTAKRAVAAFLNPSSPSPGLAAIEIRPAPSGAPEVFIGNRPAECTISISHRDGVAACAIAQPGARLGCDLELVEPRSEAFIADYFTGDEQDQVARAATADRFRVVALVWSAKESALKALHVGLRLDTRSVTVTPGEWRAGEDWCPLWVRREAGETFHGWWQRSGTLLCTLVGDPPPDRPVTLRI